MNKTDVIDQQQIDRVHRIIKFVAECAHEHGLSGHQNDAGYTDCCRCFESVADAMNESHYDHDEAERLLRLCHNAPIAVGIDTRCLATAIHRLIDFAWKPVSA